MAIVKPFAPQIGAQTVRMPQAHASSTLYLDPSLYPGGVAIWGAMPPVLNTTAKPDEAGVHVHARKTPGKRKEIDETFELVVVQLRPSGQAPEVIIDGVSAQAFNIAEILGLRLETLSCPRCGHLHLDIRCSLLRLDFKGRTSGSFRSTCWLA